MLAVSLSAKLLRESRYIRISVVHSLSKSLLFTLKSSSVDEYEAWRGKLPPELAASLEPRKVAEDEQLVALWRTGSQSSPPQVR